MKILFVCRFLPHPRVRDSGGQDTFRYILSLSEKHAVSLIAFVSSDQKEAVASMSAICEEVVTVPYRHHALLPRLWRAWWRLLMPRVYGRVFSLQYRKCLRDLLDRSSFDLVVVDGMMAQYGNLARGVKRVLDEVDVYSVVAYHLYRNEKRPLFRVCALLDWLRTLTFELHFAGAYDSILVRSEKDRIILQDHLPRQKILVVSPWFEGLAELQDIEPCRPPGNNLLFVGAMNLPANAEAVLYFAWKVLPLIQQRVPDVTFYIVGAAPAPAVKRLEVEKQGVIVTGEVQNLRPYYEQCAVNVVPLLTGGGVIVKTLNGMAAGRPTVATLIGNSGTSAEAGRDLLVVDENPEAFAEAVVRLLVDEPLWTKIATDGQRFIKQRYNWDQVDEVLGDLCESLVARHPDYPGNTSKGLLKLK